MELVVKLKHEPQATEPRVEPRPHCGFGEFGPKQIRIGIGIFQAASLQAAAALPRVPYHEYQHSIFDANLKHLIGNMRCEGGFYHLPDGPGIGVEPNESVLEFKI